MERASLADFRDRVTKAHQGEAWISEGNFASWTFDIRLPRAEALIVLDRPRGRAFGGSSDAQRWSGAYRPDLPDGCAEQIDHDLLDYIWNFRKVGGPEIEAARLAHGPSVPVFRLSRNCDVSAFLSSLQ